MASSSISGIVDTSAATNYSTFSGDTVGESISISITSTPNNVTQDDLSDTARRPTPRNWRILKSNQRKVKNLENIIQSLSPYKQGRKKGKFPALLPFMKDKLEVKFDIQSSDAVIEYFKSLKKSKKWEEFHWQANLIYGPLLDNADSVKWLANKLNVKHQSRFMLSIKTFRGTQKHRGGHNRWCTEIQQKIYDMWITNSITSTVGYNNRNMVKISKVKYEDQYDENLTHKDVIVHEQKNKRGTACYVASRRIVTTTVRGLLSKILSQVHNSLSIGTLLNLKPFFVQYSTDREMILCLCKLCLNVRFLFRALVARAQKDDETISDSITEFFMINVTCMKTEIGYFPWKCCMGQCTKCKNADPLMLKCSTSDDTVTVHQFESTETPYKKKDKKTGVETDTLLKKTEKIPITLTYAELYKKSVSVKKKYITHRYQVLNDRFHWRIILSSIQDTTTLYHLDYSENLVQMDKEEAQSAHFNKSQYTLHCAVQHNKEG